MHNSLAREILMPHSIQCCVLNNGKLGYKHMEPSYSFGAGYQHDAVCQLVRNGLEMYSTSIPGGRSGRCDTPIYVLAEPDFDIDGYRVYLERMAQGTLTLDAPTDFERAAVGQHTATAIWFDFTTKVAAKNEIVHNAVFWTLSSKVMGELIAAIKLIHC